PMGMVFDGNGNLIVCEQNFSRIVSVAPNATESEIAGHGANGFADGAASRAMFSRPVAVDIDPNGNIYVADLDNARIRRIAGGQVTTIAGVGAFTGDGASSTDAFLNYPQGVVTDAAGNLYIA